MSEPSISVIVVSYHTLDCLRRCLSCIEPDVEVIVVDNASTDGSPEMVAREFPHVRLIANAENRGFGAANNQGIAIASGDLILFLNSDAYAEAGAIRVLAGAFEHETTMAAGGRLLNLDGSLQESVAARLTLGAVFLEQTLLDRIFRHFGRGYWRTPRDEGGPVQVDQVMGACLMMRRRLGLIFDERFFMYCEDTELCHRISRLGQIVYVPAARFTHELGASSAAFRWRAVARYNRGKELYFEIISGQIAASLCWLLDRSGALMRLIGWTVISVVRPSRWSLARLFARVLLARANELV